MTSTRRKRSFSVVEFLPNRSGHSCGYCGSSDGAISIGLWSYAVNVVEYQNLIDRGWRRSGCYLYKPCLKETCCAAYSIRCEVGAFHISKSQKKVLKRFNSYLKFGEKPKESGSDSGLTESPMPMDIPSHMKDTDAPPRSIDLNKIAVVVSPSKEGTKKSNQLGKPERPVDPNAPSRSSWEEGVKKKGGQKRHMDLNAPSTSSGEKDGSGVNPKQGKAKFIRLHNKYNKLRSRGITEEEAILLTYKSKKNTPEEKGLSFEDHFVHTGDMSTFTHKLKIKLHSVSELIEDEALCKETHSLYLKYQMAVHGDKPEGASMKQFIRFLVDTPLYDKESDLSSPSGFGTFHQQYWLDERLIAVGVIDILPKCLSSVYFFYDPDLSFMSLGTYGSLQEIYFTRFLVQQCPSIKFYYLGYYIHTCPKMVYKGRYSPSDLLCPETLTWHPIDKCRILLEKNKYVRFEEDPNVTNQLQCDVNLEKVMILYNRQAMRYINYKMFNPEADDEEVIKYGRLVGEECYQSLLLYRE